MSNLFIVSAISIKTTIKSRYETMFVKSTIKPFIWAFTRHSIH